MRLWLVILLSGVMVGGCAAQEARRANDVFNPANEWNLFGEYSNDSSHILLGRTNDRHLALFGGGYSRRLRSNRFASWRWQFEVTPAAFVSNPRLTTVETFAPTGSPGQSPVLPETLVIESLQGGNCKSGSGNGNVYAIIGTGEILVGTYSYTSTCTHPVTYGAGISPLGQRVNFLPRKRLQPYFSANAGFLLFTTAVPSIGATAFNFEFEGGVGLEWFQRPGHSWSLDYRFHHISNAYTGNQNPGIDSGVFRVGYQFGR